MADMQEVVIASACRTPIGSFNGALSSISATELGSIVVKEAISRAGIDKTQIDEVIMGNVLAAGNGQAPARQSAIKAGLPPNVGCLTINKVCGSGLKAVMLGTQAIMVGDADIIVAGGMENMSRTPFLLEKARNGYRLGHGQIVDSMIRDGLWDVYNDFHMGNAAELCARECNITREMQDDFTELSYKRTLAAQKQGLFQDEIVSVEIPQRKGDAVVFSEDEEPQRVNFEKIKKIKPVFESNGTVTAANASSINDGAAALVIMSSQRANELDIKPLAKIVGQATASKAPEWFTTAPVDAIQKILDKLNLSKGSIDLFEINEAFAVVSLSVNKLLGLDVEKVNVNGGAVALGHPIGASGSRILTTLLYAMQQRKAKLGLAAICIGGGEASALVVERV